MHNGYGSFAEVFSPAAIEITPESHCRIDWDGKGERDIRLAVDEFFMPILCLMALPGKDSPATFDSFLRFSLFENPHDLATSIYSRDDRKLQRGRRVLAGMVKENDGTDSALDWEEFGSGGTGDSGNMGVGEVQATLSIFSRRQKGRHLVF